MGVRLSYRERMRPKFKGARYYRKQGVHVHKYRDEDGIERYKITKYVKWGKYPDVDDNENNQSVLQDSRQE